MQAQQAFCFNHRFFRRRGGGGRAGPAGRSSRIFHVLTLENVSREKRGKPGVNAVANHAGSIGLHGLNEFLTLAFGVGPFALDGINACL